MGPVESAVEAFIKELGDLAGTETALVAIAKHVARDLDINRYTKDTPALARELRLVLKQLTDGHVGGEDDEWGDLGRA